MSLSTEYFFGLFSLRCDFCSSISCHTDAPAAIRNANLSVSVTNNGLTLRESITPTDREVLFIGLGDSYSSGEGMGYWEDVGCRRSILACSALVAARYALDNSDVSAKYRSVACSGATANILTGRVDGDPRHIPKKSQLKLLRNSLCGHSSKVSLEDCIKSMAVYISCFLLGGTI